MSRPLLKQGRVWLICLWASVCGGGVGAMYAAYELIARAAADQSALLVPAAAWNQEQRDRVLGDVKAMVEVREASWLSPAEIARETSSLLPPERWPEIISEDDAWLPWVMEIRWRDPIHLHEAIRLRAKALRLDAQWKFVLWDDEILMARHRGLVNLIVLGGSALALTFLIGLAALAAGPARERSAAAESALALLLTAFMLGGMGSLAMIEGFYLSSVTWGVGGGVAFILAAILAPMIKRPESAVEPKSESENLAPAVAETESSVSKETEPIREEVETAPPSEEPQNASE